ncbi:MAG: DUF1549 and DUF1553 domain-containing protein [Planctomycetota bacterium]|nr:DUF1549 and DUF1553 domain-containing protein [Planctomycetota bacterium]
MHPIFTSERTVFWLPVVMIGLLPMFAQGQNPKDHWAFQPLQDMSVPYVMPTSNMKTPIDRFIQKQLASQQLALSSPADRTTWLRRVSYDLRGLPPTPTEVRNFLEDSSPVAYEAVIDRLLASPSYGERWGKYWLDVVGYADSNGYFSADTNRPYAFHYRDYVIRSLNADKGYDQFIREQLAGDEWISYLSNPSVSELRDLMVATHFLRNAPDGSSESDGNPDEVTIDRATALEGSLQIMMNALLGLTIQCARCHDHKFEPIGHEEYYRLQAIFYPAFPAFHNDAWVPPVKRIGSIAGVNAWTLWKRQTADIDQRIDKLKEEKKRAPDKAEDLDKQIETINSKRPQSPGTVAWVTDVMVPAPEVFRLESGNYQSQAELVHPSGLSVLDIGNPVLPARPISLPALSAFAGRDDGTPFSTDSKLRLSTGRRLAFAQWITKPHTRASGLLARVIANRIWQFHFGTGLVSTPDNFGLSGSPASHPDLLEYLASYLVDRNWSMKALHQLILRSAVYQQASEVSLTTIGSRASEVDPANRLLWKFPLRRLDAEAIRDGMLVVSGELDRRMYGPYTPTQRTATGNVIVPSDYAEMHRRSIYLQQRRTQVNTFLELFDAPSIISNCPERGNSTVPLQSLALLNSTFVLQQASAFARRLDRFPPDETIERIQYSFLLLLGRLPTSIEQKAAFTFIKKQQLIYHGSQDSAAQTWSDYCQMLLATNAFLYLE